MSHSAISVLLFFFFNDTATTEIYTLSLHDALPILLHAHLSVVLLEQTLELLPHLLEASLACAVEGILENGTQDRKSTRLNSSHANISYAVFCLKKKKK